MFLVKESIIGNQIIFKILETKHSLFEAIERQEQYSYTSKPSLNTNISVVSNI